MSTITPELSPQTVQRLVVERFKRVTDVEIVPDATTPTVLITGKNYQGKSSVLDALEAVFTGVDKRTTPRPIHEGEDTARIVAETEALVITRTFRKTAKGTDSTLVVAAKDGARYGSPQKMLDELFGSVSVDPVEFADLDPKAQRDTLLRMVELPFNLDQLDRERADAYAARTAANREEREAGVLAARAPLPAPGAPMEEVSVSELVTRLHKAQQTVRAIEDARRVHEVKKEKVRLLREQLAAAETEEAQAHAVLSEVSAQEPEDVETLTEQLAGIEQTNAGARENQRLHAQRAELVKAWKARQDVATKLDEQVKALDKRKADGLAAAQFPVEGLSFGEEGILYKGQPFAQASTAERIRVSVAVATAKPGTIRVLLVRRGESLDQENLSAIGELAAEQGYQVWVEAVREERSIGVWHMEDGHIAS